MQVTLLQQDIVWADPSANRKLAEKAILSAPKSDLYILPEMWSTGFATMPEGIAEGDCASLDWMRKMANNINAAIAGSVATEEDGKYYNRFYFVTPLCGGGTEGGTYDKHHLFTYGGEHLRYTAGNRRVVVEWRGVRFLLQICYDLRFPIFARNTTTDCSPLQYGGKGEESYDAIIYVASWPVPRRSAWDALLVARAIENQCYVLGVNRIGADPACRYNGGTVAIDAYGHTMAACPDDEVSAITIDIDMESLTAFRSKFPVLKDRD